MSVPFIASPYLPGYLQQIRSERKYSDHTITAYQKDLESFFAYTEQQYSLTALAQVRPIHIRSWLAEMISESGAKATTIKRKKSSVQSFFKYLVLEGAVPSNPASAVPTPNLPKRLPKVIEAEAIERIISLGEQQYRPASWEERNEMLIIQLLFETGMRRAELSQIQEDDIDLQRRTMLIFGKGRKERTIPLHPDTIRVIQDYMDAKRSEFPQAGPQLLVTPGGKKMYDQYIYRTVKKFLSENSISSKKSPHVLRHTFATELLNNGADISAIKDLLGHASLAATQIYAHVNIENLKKEFRKSHPRS